MKYRTGFVSNSSTSSYIVIGYKPSYVSSVQLEKRWARELIRYYNDDEWNQKKIDINRIETEPVYLTAYVSDGNDDAWDEFQDRGSAYYFEEGNHGCVPRSEDHYIDLSIIPQYKTQLSDQWSTVWFRKDIYGILRQMCKGRQIDRYVHLVSVF